ncbi:MAG: hypothetical protein V3T83_22085 [Acidobacteriota bacterium]
MLPLLKVARARKDPAAVRKDFEHNVFKNDFACLIVRSEFDGIKQLFLRL